MNASPAGPSEPSKERQLAMHKLSRRRAVHLLVIACFTLPWPPADAADEVPLAIKGYDPVAYFAVGSPTPGLPDIEHTWDEYRYRFSKTEHRELFKANPASYAPQFANFCSVSLARGLIVEADPESWLISDGKLYLFGGPAGPRNFQQSLAENIAKANDNRFLIPNAQR
jgi:hypothetical protein